jgi:hypothetical protein
MDVVKLAASMSLRSFLISALSNSRSEPTERLRGFFSPSAAKHVVRRAMLGTETDLLQK